MKRINKISLVFVLLLNLVFVLNGFCLSLDEAKSKGLVGEMQTGYLGEVVSSKEGHAVVDDINSKRRQKYQEIAKSNGTALAAVEQLAGKKAIENTQSGNFIKLPSGQWVKK